LISVDELIERARAWIGVPFHHQGRSRAGIDCIGLPEAILRDAGVLPAGYDAPRNYGRRPIGELERGLQRWCAAAPRPVRGCLLALRWPAHGGISHVAILAGDTIIHAYHKRGVCEHAYRAQWVKWTRSAWHLPGVAYE